MSVVQGSPVPEQVPSVSSTLTLIVAPISSRSDRSDPAYRFASAMGYQVDCRGSVGAEWQTSAGPALPRTAALDEQGRGSNAVETRISTELLIFEPQ
jgi:hypothetical protein